jgi:hypothetical protein
MKPKVTFTRKDFLVALGCLVFVLAGLGAVGSGGRRRAKEMVCLSNLKKWGVVFKMFTDDNNGRLMTGHEWEELLPGGSGWPYPEQAVDNIDHSWWFILSPYYKNYRLLCCPEADRRPPEVDEGRRPRYESIFSTWALYIRYPDEWAHGSYGFNSWAYDRGLKLHGARFVERWGRIQVRGAERIPLVLDCYWCEGYPFHTDGPPPWQYFGYFGDASSPMRCFCMDRHMGGTGGLFFDLSARKTGLKELWELTWHSDWNPDNDPPPSEFTDPNHWMYNLKDYSQ